MRRIHNLRGETGLALPIAMGIMMVLAIALVAVIGFTTAGARDSDRSQAENDAFAVAEAEINVALSILGNAPNPTVSTLLPSPTTKVTVQSLVPGATAWPDLQSLIAGQMYGSFALAAIYKLILGEQVG